MCLVCEIRRIEELERAGAEADINQKNAEAVANLTNSILELENFGRTDLAKRVEVALSRILPPKPADEPQQATDDGIAVSAAGINTSAGTQKAEPTEGMPARLLELLEELGEYGVVQIGEFTRH